MPSPNKRITNSAVPEPKHRRALPKAGARKDGIDGRQRPKSAVTAKPQPPKTAKGKRRRQQLIAAVGAVLNSRGYRDMGINDIVAEAGAPVGLFYRYFRSKTEVVVAALEALVEDFRSGLPPDQGEGSLFEWLRTSHERLFALFVEQPGLLGCYYSFDYGEPAFARLFHSYTLQFDRDSIAHALVALGRKDIATEDLIPLAHALTSMIDNFAFRYSTGRDETSRLEKATKVNLARLTAILRYRGLTLKHPPEEDPIHVFAHLAARRVVQSRIELPEPRLTSSMQPRRSPKRSDSAQTYAMLKSVALQLLNRLPYDDMRISDIESESKTTRGSIYHYFGEKRDLVIELIGERLEAIQSDLKILRKRYTTDKMLRTDLFTELSTVIGVFVREYNRNPGLLRTIYQIEDREPDIAEFLLAYRRCWTLLIIDLLSRFLVSPVSKYHQLDILAHAVLAMVERFCYDLYVTPVSAVAPKLHDANDATNLLATVWYRILLLKNPDETVPTMYPFLTAMVGSGTRSSESKRLQHGTRNTRRSYER